MPEIDSITDPLRGSAGVEPITGILLALRAWRSGAQVI